MTATRNDPNPRVTNALRQAGHAVLAIVAACGAVLSYDSLHAAAEPVFGDPLAYGFPLLVDTLILGASLQYVSGARTRAPGRHGWRLTAHAGIAGTIALNALASNTVAGVPWHVTAPIVWAVLVELYARQFAGEWKAAHSDADAIPLRLWIRHPLESARAWLMQARRSADPSAHAAAGVHAAAVEAIRLTLPGVRHRGRRRLLTRLLRSSALTPGTILDACGWTGDSGDPTPRVVMRVALSQILEATCAPVPEAKPKPRTRTVPTPQTPGPAQPSPGRDSGLAHPPGPARTNGTVVGDGPVAATVTLIKQAKAAGRPAPRDAILKEVRAHGHTLSGAEARDVWGQAQQIVRVNGSAQ